MNSIQVSIHALGVGTAVQRVLGRDDRRTGHAHRREPSCATGRHLVGVELAARMLLEGRPTSPVQAHAAGRVDELSTPATLLDRSRAVALDAAEAIEIAAAAWDAA